MKSALAQQRKHAIASHFLYNFTANFRPFGSMRSWETLCEKLRDEGTDSQDRMDRVAIVSIEG